MSLLKRLLCGANSVAAGLAMSKQLKAKGELRDARQSRANRNEHAHVRAARLGGDAHVTPKPRHAFVSHHYY